MDAQHAPEQRADRVEQLAACLVRAKEGDLTALDPVVAELNPLLWHVARSQGLTEEDAADVVQTTWLELVRHLAAIRSPLALTGWLVNTTARGVAGQRPPAQKRGARTRGHGQLPRTTAPPPITACCRRNDIARCGTTSPGFPRSAGRCCPLVAHTDRPNYAAIADALGMPHGGIGPTRGRCLAKLRAMLLADPAWDVS